MAIDEGRLRELALKISSYMDEQTAARRPQLQLVVPAGVRPPPLLDEPTRALRERRIHFLVGRYGLQWLVDQATLGMGSLESLKDEQLIELANDCERALKAVQDGVSFEDIGLVRACA